MAVKPTFFFVSLLLLANGMAVCIDRNCKLTLCMF